MELRRQAGTTPTITTTIKARPGAMTALATAVNGTTLQVQTIKTGQSSRKSRKRVSQKPHGQERIT